MNPKTPIITKNPNHENGYRIYRQSLGGLEVSDYKMRYTLCAWPHLIENSRGMIFLSGGMDTAWGALTSIVAEQTNKPRRENHAKKLVIDPHDTFAPHLRKMAAHVCDPKYAYARPEHADILQHLHCHPDPKVMWSEIEPQIEEQLYGNN